MVAYQKLHPRRGIVAASVQFRRMGTNLVATEDWQADAWRYYDTTGQGRYVANAVANAISRCKLSIVEVDPDTGETLGAADDERLRPLAASPLGVGPRRRENLRLAALNLFVAGEFYLIGEHGAPTPGGAIGRDRWYIVSGFDFDRRQTSKGLKCTRPASAGGGEATLHTDRDVIARIWTPHPKHASEADSPFRAALPDLAVLSTVRKREAAELDSRLTGAGILVWPDSVDFGKAGIQGFTDKLVAAASEIIDDPAHPNSLIPEMITMSPEHIEKIRHLTFWSELSDSLAQITERKVTSLAQSLDAPVSMTLGHEQDNHWTAWLVSEDTITTHYDPILSRIGDGLTQVFLAPGAEKQGMDPARYAYQFDTSPLRLRGDAVGDALNLWDRDLISDAALLRVASYDPEDAPDANEKAQRFARRLIMADPSLLGTALADVAGLADRGAPVVIDSTSSRSDGPQAPTSPARGRVAPPAQPAPPEAEQMPQPALTAAASGLVAVADLAVNRALEIAGGRLVKQYPADADRAALHTRLAAPPQQNQMDGALRGAWRHLPETAARLHGVDAEKLAAALDTYTRGLILSGREHSVAELETWLSLTGLAP